jgi:hypothetical protein
MHPAILALLDAQRGLVGRFQVAAILDSGDRADALLRGPWFEHLDPPVRGVRRLQGCRWVPEQQAFAHALRARPGATLTGPGALGLLRVPGFTPDDPFELLLQPGRRLRGLDVPRRVDPDPGRAVTTYGEVRVAAPLDALIDAAAFVEDVGERRIRVAWDHLRWEGVVRTNRLAPRLAELRDIAPGAVILERILRDAGGLRVESEGERSLAPILDCFDPRPERQAWVRPGRRVDYYFRPVRMAWEYLGRADHAAVADRIADDERDVELRRDGIRVQYVTAGDVADPVALLGRVAGALTIRAHELGVAPPTPVRPLPG